MRGITRAIVAVMLVVGAVPAVGAAQHTDYTGADAGLSGLGSSAGAATVHATNHVSQDDEPDGGEDDADGGANESETTESAAGNDVDGDGYGDGSGQLVDDPYDYFERLQCLETVPYDYYEAELIPCEDDSELVLVVGGGGGGLTAIHLDLAAAGDGDSDGSADDGSAARAAGDDSDRPAPLSDDWWDRVRCLRPLPVDPAPPIEPIPCEDDAELVLLLANGDDGGVSQGFPVQGGVVRVHRFGPGSTDGVDRPVRKKPGRTKYADITLERGYVVRADDGSNDGVSPAIEHTDSWIVATASDDDGADGNGAADGGRQAGSASDSKAELIESIAKYEAGDGQTRNVLGGIVRIAPDGTRETIIIVKGLDEASPRLYEALADDHGDDHRTVVIATKGIDKASPKIYEAGDTDDDGDGVPTAERDEGMASDDDDADTGRAGAGWIPASVVGPGDAPCPILWPTGPFDPTGPTTRPCPVTAVFAANAGGVAGAVSPSDSHGVADAISPSSSDGSAGAVTPSSSHGVAGAVTPSDYHIQAVLEDIKHLDKASPLFYQR